MCIKTFGPLKAIIDSDKEQKKVSESCIEIERIIRLIYKYTNDYNYNFDECLHFIMITAGYAKDNGGYVANSEELEIITNLCLQYMKKYCISTETFIYKICAEYDRIKEKGFSTDIKQKIFFDLRDEMFFDLRDDR